MEYRTFKELLGALKGKQRKMTCAVVGADSENILTAVLKVSREGYIDPVLIGDEIAIRACLEKVGAGAAPVRIVHTHGDKATAETAVALAKSGEADILIKGYIDTSLYLSPILNRENGLPLKNILSSFAVFEIPTYHKLLATTDAGIMLHPTLEQKKIILQNAVAALRQMGVPCPKVAVVAALETPTPKMPETMDAAALQKMNENGEIKDCIVAGPISYDLAINKASARVKGYEHPVAGDADLLLYPNLVSGNLLNKTFAYSAGARAAFFAIGARPAIILGSRASDMEDEYLSLVIATAMGEKR